MKIKVGDRAVYPAYGVGLIKAKSTKEINGRQEEVYHFELEDSTMSILIPAQNIEVVGIREIIPSQDIKKVYEILSNKDLRVTIRPWNKRQKEYQDKLKTGSLYLVAEVVRELNFISHFKKLSYGEKQIFESATLNLVREIALAKQLSKEIVRQEVTDILQF